MMKWQPIISLTALAWCASVSLAQVAPDSPAPATLPATVPPAPGNDLEIRGNTIRIRGINGPGQIILNGGVIIINGQVAGQVNGQLILNGPVIGPGDEQLAPISLPIVNDGFANDQDVAGSIEPLVSALRSHNFGEREDASLALLRLPPGRLNDVVDALSHATDAEAIERLTQAAAHLYLKPRTLLKTRASVLGVWHQQPNFSLLGLKYRMDPVKLLPADDAPTMTVLVTDIQPGFPATQTLRNGDRIVAMGGVGFPPELALADSTYFRSRVASLWPGAVVRMLVQRDGKVVELGVQVTGLPLNGPTSPDVMVAMRQSALAAFLQTLKTGDTSQAMNTAPVQLPGPAMLDLTQPR